jgi:hypothetical protein
MAFEKEEAEEKFMEAQKQFRLTIFPPLRTRTLKDLKGARDQARDILSQAQQDRMAQDAIRAPDAYRA